LRFRSRSPATTRAVARRLGEAIDAVAGAREEALVIGLSGPLGAGKTEWVKGLAEGLGVDVALVASPSFVIASEYPSGRSGGRPLAHVDLFRVASEAELESAGFLDLLAPGRVVAVEWSDRMPAALPSDRIEVRIDRGGAAEARELAASATGPLARRVVDEWQRRVGQGEERPWR
jgi:tRNA threonylcarbamoyladenosine biosynthesis protein TsaE